MLNKIKNIIMACQPRKFDRRQICLEIEGTAYQAFRIESVTKDVTELHRYEWIDSSTLDITPYSTVKEVCGPCGCMSNLPQPSSYARPSIYYPQMYVRTSGGQEYFGSISLVAYRDQRSGSPFPYNPELSTYTFWVRREHRRDFGIEEVEVPLSVMYLPDEVTKVSTDEDVVNSADGVFIPPNFIKYDEWKILTYRIVYKEVYGSGVWDTGLTFSGEVTGVVEYEQ